MFRIIAALMMITMIAGCAGVSKLTVAPASGTVTVGGIFPYSRSSDEAVQEVKRVVAAKIFDAPAEKVRDDRLKAMVQALEGRLSLEDSPSTRASISANLLNRDITRALETAGCYRVTSNRAGLKDRGKVLAVKLTSGPDASAGSGPFSGTVTHGTNFDSYNREVNATFSQRDYYIAWLDGRLDWTPGGELSASWTLVGQTHESASGITSEFSLPCVSDGIAAALNDVVATTHGPIDAVWLSEVRRAGSDIFNILERRIVVKPEMVQLRETTYQLDFETAVARLQRLNNEFKYDAAASTFNYKPITYSKNFNGRNWPLSSRLVVKVFPEKNSAAVQYLLYYDQVDDQLTGKRLFSSDDAERELAGLIKAVNDALKR